jgi:5-deoxy-glucuronate isomerase
VKSLIRQQGAFPRGYTAICAIGRKHREMGMDFGILRLATGEKHRLGPGRERALTLLGGAAAWAWDGRSENVARSSVFDESPWVLHVPAGVPVTVSAREGGAEIAVAAADNGRGFDPRLYTPAECRSEERGKGTMRETSTRIVRTVFDDSNAPYANLVVGEAVSFPGKWSSYPPHHHPQPEVYHYRTLPEHGFGLSMLGDDACQVRHLDTLLIPPGLDHPQVAAPGYALYYLWVIRHLDGERYVTPEFTKEHAWVMDPGARIWP